MEAQGRPLSAVVAGCLAGVTAIVCIVLGTVAWFQGEIAQSAAVIACEVQQAKDRSLELALAAKDLRLHVVQVQQWLTDISATRAAKGFEDGFDEAAAHAKASRELLTRFAAEFAGDRDAVARIAELQGTFDAYYEMGQRMARAYIDGGPDRGNLVMHEFDACAMRLEQAVEPFVAGQVAALGDSLAGVVRSTGESRSRLAAGQLLLFVAMAVPAIGAIAVYLLLRRTLVRPLHRQLAVLRELAGGDLTTRCVPEGLREMHEMAAGIGEVAARLRTAIAGIASSVDSLQEQADATSRASRDLAGQSSQQAAALQEISASMAEVRSGTQANSQSAEAARQDAQTACRATDRCPSEVELLAKAMAGVQQSGSQIGKVMATIDQIAFQTNLLALNAAVEAARAGDAGRGFSVVAGEVRELAQRSATSADSSGQMIAEAQRSANEGATIVERVTSLFSEVLDGAQRVDSRIAAIAAASQAQAAEIQTIGDALLTIDRATQDGAARAEELSASMQCAQEQVEQIRSMIGRFRL